MKKLTARRARSRERGFALMETLIGLVMFAIVLTIGLQMLLVRAASIEQTARQRLAEESSESALEALARRSATELPATAGTFTLNADNTITVTGVCGVSNCDMVLDPEPDILTKTSVASGYPMTAGGNSPPGETLQFIRRWRVDTVDAALGLRQITVVVLRDTTSTQPLAVKRTQVDLVVR